MGQVLWDRPIPPCSLWLVRHLTKDGSNWPLKLFFTENQQSPFVWPLSFLKATQMAVCAVNSLVGLESLLGGWITWGLFLTCWGCVLRRLMDSHVFMAVFLGSVLLLLLLLLLLQLVLLLLLLSLLLLLLLLFLLLLLLLHGKDVISCEAVGG